MQGAYVVILAGGKGTRMQSDLPKVLVEVLGQPLILRVLDSVARSALVNKPVVVVGYKADLVQQRIGNRADYVLQAEQLGTGHAVRMAKDLLRSKARSVVVLYGDHPLISSAMLNNLVMEHQRNHNVITMATTVVPDFNEWRSAFVNFGRIVRDQNGRIIGNVEYKDASEVEREITEVNPCYFCFDSDWLWQKLDELDNHNIQNEYYLTDLIAMAFQEGKELASVFIDPSEALGVNSAEQLKMVEDYLKQNKL